MLTTVATSATTPYVDIATYDDDFNSTCNIYSATTPYVDIATPLVSYSHTEVPYLHFFAFGFYRKHYADDSGH